MPYVCMELTLINALPWAVAFSYIGKTPILAIVAPFVSITSELAVRVAYTGKPDALQTTLGVSVAVQ
jgi:hypothetical protein